MLRLLFYFVNYFIIMHARAHTRAHTHTYVYIALLDNIEIKKKLNTKTNFL